MQERKSGTFTRPDHGAQLPMLVREKGWFWIASTHSTVGPVHRRETRAGGDSASHSSVATPPAADDATSTTTPAATTLAASSSPDVAVSTADGAMATAASAADTGMDVNTDPSPAVIAPPTTEHISSFLLRIRRRTADDATSSSPDATEDNADGATADVASATGTNRNVDRVRTARLCALLPYPPVPM